MRGRRVLAVAVALGTGALLVACGGGGDDGGDAATTTAPLLPEACQAPPVTIDLQAGGTNPAGSDSFEVTDAAARRVAILPGQMAFDPSALSGLEKAADVTPLAAYTLYLTDFPIKDADLEGVAPEPVRAAEGQTVGALSLVPLVETGLVEGAVVTDGELDYETNTTFKPLSVTVYADGDTTAQGYTDVEGQAEVLQLDDKTICVDFDVTLSNSGEMVYRAKGTVVAPVVRAANAYFFT